jgi:hypothetical protein
VPAEGFVTTALAALASAPAMGQPIAVTRKPSSRPGVVRFEINRSLTGMGHERYRSASEAAGDRPPDVLARRLFEVADRGGPGDAIRAIHVYSNVISIEAADGADGAALDVDALEDAIRSLYIHYKDGVTPSFAAS